MRRVILGMSFVVMQPVFSAEMLPFEMNTIKLRSSHDICEKYSWSSCREQVRKYNNDQFNFSQGKLSKKSFVKSFLDLEKCIDEEDSFCREE